MRTILVTGGAGYIGSHVCKALREAGYEPVAFDNLSHGHRWAVRFGPFFQGDLKNSDDLNRAFETIKPEAVIHLAGSIHLRESIENPIHYYFNNVLGSLSLLRAMVKHEVTSLVFSSSAAIYADPEYVPLDENHPKLPLNPYGKSKWMVEQMLEDFHAAHGLNGVSLRYFNAAGADLEGEIGEAHNPETHLIPKAILAAQNKGEHLTIYNSKLPTPDGTAIRDYVHVSDLAQGHVSALQWVEKNQRPNAFNLGSGRGYSVKEVIAEVEKITGFSIETKIGKKTVIETPILVADIRKAARELGWNPIYSELSSIIETAWNWHSSPLLAKI